MLAKFLCNTLYLLLLKEKVDLLCDLPPASQLHLQRPLSLLLRITPHHLSFTSLTFFPNFLFQEILGPRISPKVLHYLVTPLDYVCNFCLAT